MRNRGMGPGGFGPPGGGMPVQKAKNFRGTLKRLLSYLGQHRMALSVVFITSIFSTVFTIISPKLLGQITTKLYSGMMLKLRGTPGMTLDFPYIWRMLLILGVLYLFSAVFGYVQQYVMAGVAQRIVYQMRKELQAKLARVPLKFFDNRSHGEILSRVVNDMDNISSTLQQSLVQLVTSIVTLVGVIVMMLSISWIMTLIVIVTLPFSFLITVKIASKSQRYFMDQRKLIGELNGHVEEVYTGHDIVKAFNREEDSIRKFKSKNKQLYEVGWKAQFISGMIMPFMSFIGNIGYVLVCVVGGVLVTRGSIQVGDIQAFIQYARQFSQPITRVANIANIIQSTIASAERVFEVLDEPEDSDQLIANEAANTAANEAAGAGQMVENLAVQGNVQFHDVSFSYNQDVPLLRNIRIRVKPGQSVAIVGPTGAGKTTLVNLLMRFYEIDSGSITVDGVDIAELRKSQLRGFFGMVLQDTWLFHGTIRENIAYGRIDATEDEIVQAAMAAHAHHFILTLPDGYETVINQEASNLSQGQKQLLTIARAFLADPPILILDEATSSVDTRTEVQIQNAMQALMKGRTNFIIAHRLSTIRDANLILVMDKGAIIEQGTHSELLQKNGFYAELYHSQFGNQFNDVSSYGM
ncbi:ABC transporter ATP-binding protein [Alicyclobacillus sp. SO9]|uniref:ABC transporter ATP-binding protein n=1 Tax=Alicyclobacillus sp. SO9 TaxID=2665646 RepID=UPI0018E899E3|nr:ABC transporter ATP-binding protein [Alicyclobacillus sp. SO9]QQE81082.1 ABC transporter ATP-binding protein [Alicyclobacillus sp. SO9]